MFWGKQELLTEKSDTIFLKTGSWGFDGEEEKEKGESWDGWEGGREKTITRGTSAHLLEYGVKLALRVYLGNVSPSCPHSHQACCM